VTKKKADQQIVETITKAETAPSLPAVPLEVAAIQSTIEKLETVKRFIQKNLNPGRRRLLKKIGKRPPTPAETAQLRELEIDFGTVPGINRNFLKQPGAEKIAQWLHVRPRYESETTPIPDHPGHIEVAGRCKIMAITPAGEFELFSGPLASCSTMESNYRYRWVDMDPQPTFDWSMKEGKTAKGLGTHRSFKDKKTDKWVWQTRHENPNIYDERNKVRQIGEKRMLVKAMRNWGALSEVFTEDPSEWILDDDSNVTPEAPIEPGKVKREEPTPTSDTAESDTRQVYTLEVRWPSDTSEVAFVHIPECPAGIEVGVKIAEFGTFRKESADWQIPGGDVATITEFALSLGMEVNEVEIDKKPAPPAAKSAGSNVAPPSKGKVTQVSRHPGRQKNTFYYLLVIDGRSLYCYKTDWFEHLAKAKDQVCEFELQDGAYPKIVGIKQIGATHFDEGLPVIQNKDR
jgi:hypothetical protein